MQAPKEKISIGFACCRRRNGEMQILLVRKRYTYAFSAFVNGRYKSNAKAEILALLNKMTLEEKLDIRSLKFEQMWYRVWLTNPRGAGYYTAKHKFESQFQADGGVKLNKLMKKSTHYEELLWEIPKGRKKSSAEPEINCAIREFQEETQVEKRSYRISLDTYKLSYISDGKRFTFIYYFALADNTADAKISPTDSVQVGEISAIGWFSLKEISHLAGGERIHPIAKKAMRSLKRR